METLMKIKILMLLLAATVASHAQDMKSWPDACGNQQTQFKVKTEKSGAPNFTAEAGKAKVVFVELLDGDFPSYPTARMALDGSWVGADKGDSYFAVSVEPGTHQLCAARQSAVREERANVGLVKVNAEVGKVYIYEFKVKRTEVGNASLQGGNSLPGQYPGSMTAKQHPTVDGAELKELSIEEFQAIHHKLALGTSSVK
jgi:hypothetical protein